MNKEIFNNYMKKFFISILIVLLSACSAVTPEPTPTLTPMNTITPLPATSGPVDPAETPKQTASPDLDAYVNKIYFILDDLSQASEEMDQLFILAKARDGYMTDEAWLERINKTFVKLLDGADRIEAIDPVPAQAESAHEYFLLAADELRRVVAANQEFIDGNVDGEESAKEYMQLHQSYVQKGLTEIYKYQPGN
jgi:hypothetical protein